MKTKRVEVTDKNGNSLREEIYILDDNDRCVHYKDSEGVEYWSEYDKKGNEIHRKYLQGFEYWQKFDTDGNRIILENSDGDLWVYDKSGEEIYHTRVVKGEKK